MNQRRRLQEIMESEECLDLPSWLPAPSELRQSIRKLHTWLQAVPRTTDEITAALIPGISRGQPLEWREALQCVADMMETCDWMLRRGRWVFVRGTFTA